MAVHLLVQKRWQERAANVYTGIRTSQIQASQKRLCRINALPDTYLPIIKGLLLAWKECQRKQFVKAMERSDLAQLGVELMQETQLEDRRQLNSHSI